ncbi:MAG: peptidoglycan-associated lipoprotein Pal [Alphaproteobacteria bacterium]|nr:peptidoglycan-associated lipoprotein Pal [Alphaproteobacteria bacterium]
MFTRFLMMLAVVVLVGACSSTEDEAVLDQQSQAGALAAGEAPLSDIYGQGTAAPGTQADLAQNVGDHVLFGYDRYDLEAGARTTLEAQANWLMQYPNLNATIEGHADERGTREYNLALGERRANSVKNYLIAFGVDPRRINTISYGKERPAVGGADESSWAQNRRAVTKVD